MTVQPPRVLAGVVLIRIIDRAGINLEITLFGGHKKGLELPPERADWIWKKRMEREKHAGAT